MNMHLRFRPSWLVRSFALVFLAVGPSMSPATAQETEQPAADTPDGWIPLFNGRDLAGWTVEGGDFVVEDGMLVLAGGTGWLRSNLQYADFELHVEWRTAQAGYDSGLFFKAGREGRPWPTVGYQVQMADGAEGAVGGLAGANPNGREIRPPGQWNTFDLRCEGMQASLAINGATVWQVETLDPREGFLGIQAEGHRIDFRNIRIRELNFHPLFNGENLEGWEAVGGEQAWHAEDGLLYCSGGGGGWLSTAQEYADFILRLEFRVPEGGNSGIFIRAPRSGDPAYSGMEIQVLDDYSDHYADLRPTQYTGAIYDVVPPSERVTRQAGQWNEIEIRAVGRRVTITLNGTQIVDADLDQFQEHYERHPGLTRQAGYIGLQNHGSRLDYRRLRIHVIGNQA